jgi:hypothetical protein
MLVLLLGLGAVLSPHVLIALGLAFAAGGIRLVGRDATRIQRAGLAVGLAFLGVATWLMATIIGPLPATYGALGDGPVGDPAARLLMLLLAVPVTVYFLDWRLIPAGAALLGRVGVEILPAGIVLWQGIAMPLALVVGFIAVRRHRADWLGVAVGAFGLWSGSLLGRIGGGAALAARVLAGASPEERGSGHLVRILGIAGAVAALAGTVRVQFVYTVLFAALLVGALLRRWFRKPPV